MTVAQSARPSSSNITVTLKRLVTLLDKDETDEYGILQPSQSAFKLAMRLLLETYEAMGDSLPKAHSIHPLLDKILLSPTSTGEPFYKEKR